MKADPISHDRLHDVAGEGSAHPFHSKALYADPLSRSRLNATDRHRRRSMIAIALIALAAVCAAATWWWLRSQTNTAEEWVTAPVTVGDIEDTVTALGNLQPRDYVDVGAQVSGQLMHIDVQVGQAVKAGDLLAEIDPTLAQAKVRSDQAASASLAAQLVDRQAQLDLAAKQLQRQRNLMRSDATSEDALQIAEAALRSNKAQLDVLRANAKQAQSTLAADQANLGYTRIYAPMAGTVVSLTARQGQTLNATQQAPVILRIADLSTMTVWTQVSEADVPRLKIGMDAYFATLGDQSMQWRGKLQQILPTPDVVNNVVLFLALFDVANPNGSLMTQMSAQVFFVVATARHAITVPVAALSEGLGDRSGKTATDDEAKPDPAVPGDAVAAKSYQVRVIGADGRIARRQVQIGVMNRVSAEVLSGLEPGEQVVIGRAGSDDEQAGDASAARSQRSPYRSNLGRGL